MNIFNPSLNVWYCPETGFILWTDIISAEINNINMIGSVVTNIKIEYLIFPLHQQHSSHSNTGLDSFIEDPVYSVAY